MTMRRTPNCAVEEEDAVYYNADAGDDATIHMGGE